jgi:hypothetical protein
MTGFLAGLTLALISFHSLASQSQAASSFGSNKLHDKIITAPIQLPDGHWIEAQIRIPKQHVVQRKALQKYPALLIFGGFETAGDVLNLLPQGVPVIFATFDYPYRGPRKFEFPNTLFEFPKLKHALHDMRPGIKKLFEFLQKLPEVDSNQLGIIGASFGAPFAISAAADERRFKYLIVPHGFADLSGTLRHRLNQVIQKKVGCFSRPLSSLLAGIILAYLNPPDPTAAAQNLRENQNVLVINAQGDHFIPQEIRDHLWSTLQKSSAEIKRIDMPGDHLQPGSQQLIYQITHIIFEWLT